MCHLQKGELKYLTSGEKDVTAILQVTRSMQTGNTVVYYMSTRDDKPGERHAYSVEEPSTKRYFNSHYDLPVKQPPEVQCYTCDRIEQNQCLYNRISWSKQSTYYIQECLGPDIPFSVLKRADDQNSTVPWVDNQQLRKNLANKLLPTIKTELINRGDYGKWQSMKFYSLSPKFFPINSAKRLRQLIQNGIIKFNKKADFFFTK